MRDRWTPTHTNTTIPAAAASNGQPYSNDGEPISSRLLENGANVRLSSLTLTYRLRQTETQDLSVWVGGQNLVVLTGYRGYATRYLSAVPFEPQREQRRGSPRLRGHRLQRGARAANLAAGREGGILTVGLYAE